MSMKEPEDNTLKQGDLEGLSKEELVELVRLYSKLFFAMDGFWYLAVRQLVSEDMATTCDLWVWDKYARYELKRLLPLMNIEGDDLAAFATAFSFSPWFSNLKHKFTREGENKVTLTVLDCPSLDAMRREGMGRENTFCPQVEQQLLQIFAQSFNPRARVIPIELPLKTSDDGICCRWQFVIDE
ncbi:MAG: DUF6125 family protein [Dehalococcoidia bacterium]